MRRRERAGRAERSRLAQRAPFLEGVALAQWLGVVGASPLPIYYTRHNADVLQPEGPAGTPAQPWIVFDKSVTNLVPLSSCLIPIGQAARP
jgi:hypothetical protein